MKQYVVLLLLLLSGYLGFAQTFGPDRSSPATTVQDARWRGRLNMYLPHTHGRTLNGGLDTLGAMIYEDSSRHIWYRDSVLSGGHTWTMVLPGGGGGLTGANQGLSVSGSTVQLGQAVLAAGDPAAINGTQQIPIGAAGSILITDTNFTANPLAGISILYPGSFSLYKQGTMFQLLGPNGSGNIINIGIDTTGSNGGPNRLFYMNPGRHELVNFMTNTSSDWAINKQIDNGKGFQDSTTSWFGDTVTLYNQHLKALDTSNYKMEVADATGNLFQMNWPALGRYVTGPGIAGRLSYWQTPTQLSSAPIVNDTTNGRLQVNATLQINANALSLGGTYAAISTYSRSAEVHPATYGAGIEEYSFVQADSGFHGYNGVFSWPYVLGNSAGAVNGKFAGYVFGFSTGPLWDGSLGAGNKNLPVLGGYFSGLNYQNGTGSKGYDYYASELNSVGSTTHSPVDTNHYAFFAEPFIKALHNYPLYLPGADTSYIQGKVFIGGGTGVVAPPSDDGVSKLQVTGKTSISDLLILPNIIQRSIDTTNLKVMVSDASGNTYKMFWPSTGGGGGGITSLTGTSGAAQTGSAQTFAVTTTTASTGLTIPGVSNTFTFTYNPAWDYGDNTRPANLNVFWGPSAGTTAGTFIGQHNTGVGELMMQALTSANYNTGLGVQSLNADTSGSQNTALGWVTLFSLLDGNYNTAVGTGSMSGAVHGNNNAAFGQIALDLATNPNYNTAIGTQAAGAQTGAPYKSVWIGAYNTSSTSATDSFVTRIGAFNNNSNTDSTKYGVEIGYNQENTFNAYHFKNIIIGDNTSLIYNKGIIKNYTGIGEDLTYRYDSVAKFGSKSQLIMLADSGGNTATMNTLQHIGSGIYYNRDSSAITGYSGYVVWNPISSSWVNLGTVSSGGGGGGSTALSALTVATATNTINNAGFTQEWDWNSLAGASALKLYSNSTAAASNANKILDIQQSGINATSAQTTYAADIQNLKTGTTAVNVAMHLKATGAPTDYPLLTEGGFVGLGTLTPSVPLDVVASSTGAIYVEETSSGGYCEVSGRTNNGTGQFELYSLPNNYGSSNAFLAAASYLRNTGSSGFNLSASSGTGVIRIYTGGETAAAERMRIDSIGRVHIDTMSGVSKFNVGGTFNDNNPGVRGFLSTFEKASFTDNNTSANATVNLIDANAILGAKINANNTNVTYTNGASLYIDSALKAGTNATITNPWALYVNTGKTFFGGSVQIKDGTQSNGYVLTSDANGIGSWQAALQTASQGLTASAGNVIWGGTLSGNVTIAEANNSINFNNGQLIMSGNITAQPSSLGSVSSILSNTFTDNATVASGTRVETSQVGIGTPTYAATNTGITYTNASTLYINGPPVAGTNVTITNPYSLKVAAGNSFFLGNITSGIGSSISYTHFLGNNQSTTPPTIAGGTGAGSGPTIAFNGGDQDGSISITTGTTPAGSNATIATFTFGVAFPNNAYVTLVPGNAITAALSGIGAVYTVPTTTNFVLTSGTTALAGSTAYKWFYHVGGN
jgi:hypothetical protein